MIIDITHPNDLIIDVRTTIPLTKDVQILVVKIFSTHFIGKHRVTQIEGRIVVNLCN